MSRGSAIVKGMAEDLKSVPQILKDKAAGMDLKKCLLRNVPYFFAGYFCDKTAWLWRTSPGQDVFIKLMETAEGLDALFSSPLPSFYPEDLLFGTGCAIALRLAVYFKSRNARKFRQGVEYGSAR